MHVVRSGPCYLSISLLRITPCAKFYCKLNQSMLLSLLQRAATTNPTKKSNLVPRIEYKTRARDKRTILLCLKCSGRIYFPIFEFFQVVLRKQSSTRSPGPRVLMGLLIRITLLAPVGSSPRTSAQPSKIQYPNFEILGWRSPSLKNSPAGPSCQHAHLSAP